MTKSANRRPASTRRRHHILAGMLGTALLTTATPAFADELVTNGNFNAGATGYSSTFTSNGAGQGTVLVTTNPNTINGSFDSYGDHTTGTGNMLFADPNQGATGYYWQQTFSVAANSAYSVSYWGRQAAGGPAALLDARINGVSIGSFTPGRAWEQFATTYNSGSNTSVTFGLYDLNSTNFFNDFTVDDISFSGPAALAAVPEPASWAMMLIGFGTVGGAIRTRRRRSALGMA